MMPYTQYRFKSIKLLLIHYYKFFGTTNMKGNNQWDEAVALLKSIIAQTKLQPQIKWGTEVYTLNGKNVLGAVAL